MSMRSLLKTALVIALTIFSISNSAHAVVTIFDGFGDGDLNNDGIILGSLDADFNGNDMIGDAITPGDVAITSTFNEISTVEDATDTGIRWLHSRGWTGSNGDPNRSPKSFARLVDDSVGSMPDSTHPTYAVPSLGSGHALGVESRGRGSSITGFFGQSIALGADEGDQVKVSFDFRTWISDDNLNTQSDGFEGNVPRIASLRFGLYQDTDNQIGMTNDFAGINENGGFAPAVWGTEGGHFRGDIGPVGANDDHGWYTNIDLGRTDWAGNATRGAVDFDGIGGRINEETNDFASGGRILEGSDNDFVAKTDEMAPTFTALDVTRAYNLSLTLERATVNTPGDTVKAIYTVTDIASGMSWSIEGTEGFGGLDPDEDGAESLSWDYFAIRNTTPLSAQMSDGDDFDYIMDNFMVEEFTGGMMVGPDFSGNGTIGCEDVDGLVAAIVAGANDPTYDITGDTNVDAADLTEWLVQAGAVLNANGNPILEGDANLDGNVDGQDFVIWNGSKFTTTAAWCSGDFNADGNVNGQDFVIWNSNKFTSSDVSAVPEPSSIALIIAGLLFFARRRS
jgi:hypothetical protein